MIDMNESLAKSLRHRREERIVGLYMECRAEYANAGPLYEMIAQRVGVSVAKVQQVLYGRGLKWRKEAAL